MKVQQNKHHFTYDVIDNTGSVIRTFEVKRKAEFFIKLQSSNS